MTQVKSAQRAGKNLALRPNPDERSLAQRRADFAAQMRAMALSDLDEVASRLKELHARLNRKDGRKWNQIDLALAMGIKPRTYQTWIGAKNENQSGEGYEQVARFYRRRLGDKTITKRWILFGDETTDVESETVSESSNNDGPINTDSDLLREVSEQVVRLAEIVERLDIRVRELSQRIPRPDEDSPGQ